MAERKAIEKTESGTPTGAVETDENLRMSSAAHLLLLALDEKFALASTLVMRGIAAGMAAPMLTAFLALAVLTAMFADLALLLSVVQAIIGLLGLLVALAQLNE